MKRLLFLLGCWGVAVAGLRAEPFLIGGFSPSPRADKEAGFTIAGPGYSNAEAVFREAVEVGLPAIYPVGAKVFTTKGGGKGPQELDFDAIRATVRAQVEAVAGEEAIYAWYLKPEELRYWEKLELEYLRVVSETIREADPKRRPVWMYEPNHRGRSALEKTLPYQQIAGKGLYTNSSGRKDERAWLLWSLDQQRQAIANASPGAMPVAVLEMFREPEEAERPLIPTWVRHDCYASLLGGARAIFIYSFARRKAFPSREVYYDAYARVARELNGAPALGPVFLHGERLSAPELEIVAGPKSTWLSARKSRIFPEPVEWPAITSAHYRHEGVEYLFIVNSAPQAVKVALAEGAASWKGAVPEQTVAFTPQGHLELEPWGVALFKRTP